MEPVLVHHGGDRRHLGDLMPDRLEVITGQGVLAPSASERLALEDLAELFGRHERTGLAPMAGLPAPLLAQAGAGGGLLTEGGSVEGGLEELVEFLPSRSSRSAILCSRHRINAETAACASADRVSQSS